MLEFWVLAGIGVYNGLMGNDTNALICLSAACIISVLRDK